MATLYIQRQVNLEPRDYRAIRYMARHKGLGDRGFSAALRLIIREWADHKSNLPEEVFDNTHFSHENLAVFG